MAQRRMFSLKIIDTDLFLDMPMSTRLLYYDLSMRADDDGFVGSPKKTTKMIGCSDDDIKLLIAKQFIIPFESGVCVIKDWKIHNYIAKDRYNPTTYTYEKQQLEELENSSYTLCIQGVDSSSTQVRLGEDRLGEDSQEVDKPQRKKFIVPTIDEVIAYCKERNNNVDANKWHSYYVSNGWKVGKNPMKDWKASVRTWENNSNTNNKPFTYDYGNTEGSL